MQFLLISLVVLSASLSVEAATPQERRDQLLARGRFLTTLLEGEIKLLRFEGHDLQAEGLERELEQLLTLEVELRATEVMNATDAQINRLDTRLSEIEERVGSQLRSIGRQFVSRQEIAEILRRTRDLVDLVATEVKILKSQNRSLEARGLEQEEIRLVELEIALRATQNPIEVRRLEELLVQADYRVWEILGGLGATRRKRDLKDDVSKRADELIVLANDAIKALNGTNRTNSVELIQRAERNIMRIQSELKNATNVTVIQRLEEELLGEEFQLVEDLQRVGRPVTVNQTRELLITASVALQNKANQMIAQLKAENRTQDIPRIEAEEQRIAELVNRTREATNESALRELEQRLGEAEYRLYEELERLGRNPADPREIQRVLRRAEELAVRAMIEVRNLFAANRSLEAEGLLQEEQALIQLDVLIRDAVTVADIRALEERLDRIEERIVDQLRRLGVRTLKKRDLRDDVLKRAEELVAIANNSIQTLRAQNRSGVQLIERTERELIAVAGELRALNTTNQTQLGVLEGRVLRLEFELSDDLRRLRLPIDLNERRDLLLTAAEALQQWAVMRITQLKAQNRTLAIANVEAEERTIANLVNNLKNATTDEQLTRYERQLEEAELRFADELRALGEPVITFEQINNLTRRAEDLAVKIVIAVRKLRDDGRILLAEGLQEEERQLIHLDARVRTATTAAEIARFEEYLSQAEARVEAELNRIANI